MSDVQGGLGDGALVEAVREELEALWQDLQNAYNRCIGGPGWSIEAEGLRERIITFSRLVGVTPWEAINVRTLANGIYHHVLSMGRLEEPEPVDWERVREIERQLNV